MVVAGVADLWLNHVLSLKKVLGKLALTIADNEALDETAVLHFPGNQHPRASFLVFVDSQNSDYRRLRKILYIR